MHCSGSDLGRPSRLAGRPADELKRLLDLNTRARSWSVMKLRSLTQFRQLRCVPGEGEDFFCPFHSDYSCTKASCDMFKSLQGEEREMRQQCQAELAVTCFGGTFGLILSRSCDKQTRREETMIRR